MFDTQMVAKWNLRRELMKLSAAEFYDVIAAVRGPDSGTRLALDLKDAFTIYIRRMVFAKRDKVDGAVSKMAATKNKATVAALVEHIKELFELKPQAAAFAYHYLTHVNDALLSLMSIAAFKNECVFLQKLSEKLLEAIRNGEVAHYI